jgi:hypothetical protein
MKQRSRNEPSDTIKERSGRDKDGGAKHAAADGRFNIIPQARSKVAVDERFSAMLTDPSFGSLEVRDKYGRKGKRRVGDNVAELYEMEAGGQQGFDAGVVGKGLQATKDESASASAEGKDGSVEGEGVGRSRRGVKSATRSVDIDDKVMKKLKKQDIRSAMNDWSSGSSSSSSDGSSSSSEDESDSETFGGVGGIAAAATSLIPEGQETCRLAVLHLDWDRISAKDIYAMLHSFLPPSRGLLSVTVYPSEFGKERMAAERSSGPAVAQQSKSKKNGGKGSLISSGSSGADAQADFDDDALRAYELNKLRYFPPSFPPLLSHTIPLFPH